ncbi:methyltransferase domain-containing protein [Brevundimonas sp.]|uniref:SAM-dependent methyltransferase n=1 Tax=Brevundimonas sp. TaxID=1871086 RepID=UPI00286D2BE9|nr:methyltransferase domain-containing protein [Brevundimonas sp.]
MTPTYHSIAYAGFEVANPVTLDAVLALVARTGLPDAATALDIGAGAGGISVALARDFGLRVQAIERYPDMARMIRDRAEAAGFTDKVTVIAEGSATALDRLAPADLIVALGSTEPAGPGIRSAKEIFARLAERLTSPGWLLWGDLTWKGEPPEPLRQVIGATGDYATHEGWLAAAEAAGLEIVSAEIAPDADWDAFFGGADTRVRDWLAANPDDLAAPSISKRADLSKATFDFGRPWLSFGLYLLRKR